CSGHVRHALSDRSSAVRMEVLRTLSAASFATSVSLRKASRKESVPGFRSGCQFRLLDRSRVPPHCRRPEVDLHPGQYRWLLAVGGASLFELSARGAQTGARCTDVVVCDDGRYGGQHGVLLWLVYGASSGTSRGPRRRRPPLTILLMRGRTATGRI